MKRLDDGTFKFKVVCAYYYFKINLLELIRNPRILLRNSKPKRKNNDKPRPNYCMFNTNRIYMCNCRFIKISDKISQQKN